MCLELGLHEFSGRPFRPPRALPSDRAPRRGEGDQTSNSGRGDDRRRGGLHRGEGDEPTRHTRIRAGGDQTMGEHQPVLSPGSNRTIYWWSWQTEPISCHM